MAGQDWISSTSSWMDGKEELGEAGGGAGGRGAADGRSDRETSTNYKKRGPAVGLYQIILIAQDARRSSENVEFLHTKLFWFRFFL